MTNKLMDFLRNGQYHCARSGVTALLIGLAALFVACGTVVKADAGSEGAVADGAGADLGIAGDTAKDNGIADTAIVADTPTGSETGGDGAAGDAKAQCPGAPGCICKENGDCDNAQCIEIGSSKVCATPCVDKCDEGFKCTLINSGSGDSVTICVPKYIHLCDPCVKSKDCQSLGIGDAACVNQAGQGNFCGTPCAVDGDCSAGFTCQSVNSVEGAPVKQCAKASTAPELKFGECTCSELAAAQKLQTSCFVEHKNDKGELVGKCAGVRACGASGLTTCAAPALDVEVCDGKDNDCDGLTDEGTCDAGGACNVGTCDPQTGCQYNKLNNVPCDADKNACTDNDQCKQGVCVPGPGKVCDDGNPCTTDSCDPASGCTKTADDGKACDADGDACTTADHCVGATCTVGKMVVCDNSNVCSKVTCDAVSGKCVGKAVQQGAPCDDGTVCTQADHCQDGECTGKIVSCDDNNPCTGDACDAKTGCASTNLDGIACDDDNPCTVGDLCKVGLCAKGAAKLCEAGAACVSGSCNLTGGKCDYKNKAAGVSCNDGDACTEKDGCSDGTCQGQALNCDDANPCTNDSCDNKLGCVHVNNASPCSDGDACTQSDNCAAGLCVPGVAKVCEDNNLCTADTCNKTTGNCVFDALAMNGTPCDDSNVCTLGDNCKSGICAVGIAKDCNDNNLCTDDLCDKGKGCNPNFNSKACDDGNACTKDDICQFGDCEGKVAGCSDGNVCTDDSCEPKKGCIYINNTGICNDSNACTSGDACKNSVCGGAPVNCDDGNVCSDDSCDKVNGCVNSPNVALCPDADACTTSEKCVNLNCVKKAVVCDDLNECTLDTCDAVKGCQAAKVVDKTLCSGGAKWCISGVCQAKQSCGNGIVEDPEQCDDGNLIDNDACSNACKLAPIVLTFGTCGAAGATGPTQVQCTGAYAGGPLANAVTVAAGVQSWTVPVTATYKITAAGGQGGLQPYNNYPGGLGAKMSSDIVLNKGDVINIVVGHVGKPVNGNGNTANGGAGGGGGSFVWKSGAQLPLVAAGGGGGSCLNNNGQAAATGKPGVITIDGSPATSGNNQGTNGSDSVCPNGGHGWATVKTNAAGTLNKSLYGLYNDGGGFGGGSGGGADCGGNYSHAAGGGGGYSGGGGGTDAYLYAGGGGGSYNTGINKVEQGGVNAGNGSVSISLQ